MGKKLTVITGGHSGLGLAAARCMAAESTLLLCARKKEALEKVKQELESFGADVYTFSMDVSDKNSVQTCADYASSLGDVVNVIHAAGVSPANTPADRIFSVNALGPVNMVDSFYPIMAPGGCMILIASSAAHVIETDPQMSALLPAIREIYPHWHEPGFDRRFADLFEQGFHIPPEGQAGLAYCATKNFVRWFALANTQRFSEKGSRIVSVSPGSYLTPMHQALIDNHPEQAADVMKDIPMKRWGHPYEMGKLLQFICSCGGGYLNGVDILADGGSVYPHTVPQIL